MLRASRCLTFFTLILSSALALAQTTEVRTGIFRGRAVTYAFVDGKALYEGDILLENVAPLSSNSPVKAAVIAYRSSLWPKVGGVYQVPYSIDPASGAVATINAAINQFNATFAGLIQWVPRSAENDFVNINLDPNNFSGQCASSVGRIGGRQSMGGSASCVLGTILHEMGHAIGMWHEQSRSDRDSYVSVLYQNVIKGSRANFDQVLDDAQNLSLYDYASVMHYIPFAFSRNGGPTLESIPAGIPLSNLAGYSAGDIDAIYRLYGAAPTAVTVTSNPPGLNVIVDGTTVTTPQIFTWSLNSAHTLDIPVGPQTLNSVTYTYGRWNDSTAANHTVVALPGNGELAFPPTSPAVTAYTANFIKLVPYKMSIFPSGTGTVTPTPAPQSFPPASGLFYVARQQITLTATPNAGQNFYAYLNSPYWFPGGISANPKTVYVFDDDTPINATAEFTSSPVYAVNTNPAAANLAVFVDGGFWYAPKNFALPYDAGWTAGSSHNLNINTPQYPFSINSRYVFSKWSDAGTRNHNITLPSSSATYTAKLTPQFVPVYFANQGCAGTIDVSPVSPTGDGFYPNGQLLTFTETPAAGWTFTGWQFDLTGTTPSQNLTVSDELLAVADYNTNATPLRITSLSPSAAVAGGGSFTLTINGAGFTASSLVFINNVFRAAKFVNSTTLTVAMTSSDIATPGAFQVFVENFPSGAACAAFAARPFAVANHPIVTPTPISLTFAAQGIGTTSAGKSITLKNNGSTAVTIASITASGNFSQSNTCSTLNPGATCNITVSFTPTVSGSITGAITVNDNAPDSPQLIALTGTGSIPLSISPASTAFGTVKVGSTSAAKTVTLTNNLSTVLNFSFSASGNYTAVGSGTKPCGASLAAKAKCTLAVSFKPIANGAINGAVTVTHSAAFSPQQATLSGTGSAGPTSPLSLNPTSLSFAAQPVGTSSAAKLVTVTNTSASSLTVTSLTASGNFAAVGSETTPCIGALGAGAKCTFSVTFTPSINGTLKGAAIITDTAAVNKQAVNLSGTAVWPVSFTPTSLVFAAQTVATTSASQTVTLTNNQSSTLSIVGITSSGNFTAAPGGATPCGSTLVANAQCTFIVRFTPSAVGTIKGSATLMHNAANNPQIVALTGMGR